MYIFTFYLFRKYSIEIAALKKKKFTIHFL